MSQVLALLAHIFPTACPQSAKADKTLKKGDSAFDPSETLAAKFAVMHNAVFPATVW
jgi:hypothetical protein